MAEPEIPGDIVCTCRICRDAREAAEAARGTEFQLQAMPDFWTCSECGRKTYSVCDPNGPALCHDCVNHPGWHLEDTDPDDGDDDYEVDDD